MNKPPRRQLQRTRLSEQIHHYILESWRAGELQPGQRLDELSVAETYGVSRTPAREALLQLAQDGIVVETSRGMALRTDTPKDIRDMIEMRSLLEPCIARHAAADAPDLEVERLARLHEKEKAAARDDKVQEFLAASRQFRRQLFSMSGNPLLVRAVTLFDDRFSSTRNVALRERSNRELVVRHHSRLVRAIQRRDPDAAEQAIREYFAAIRAYYAGQGMLEDTGRKPEPRRGGRLRAAG